MNSPGAYIYVLHGEDHFTRDESLRTLKERMRALPAGEHNLTELSGEDATLAALRLAADAAPFLSERRLVVIHGLLGRLTGAIRPRGTGARRRGKSSATESGKPGADLDALLTYLGDVPHTTSIAFVEDISLPTDALEARISKGRALVRRFPKELDTPAWVRRRARTIGMAIDDAAVRDLAAAAGEDLRRLDSELRKLGAYAAGRPVTRADVQELVAGRDVVIWTLLDALAERRLDRSLASLRRLYDQGESPEALLARDVAPLFRRLTLAKELQLLPRPQRHAADAASVGLNPRALPKLLEQAARFERDEIERVLDLLLTLDRQIKTGQTDAEAAMEVLIVRICTRLGAAA